MRKRTAAEHENITIEQAAQDLAKECREPDASGHHSYRSERRIFTSAADRLNIAFLSVFLAQSLCFKSLLTLIPFYIPRYALPEGYVTQVYGLYSEFFMLYINEEKLTLSQTALSLRDVNEIWYQSYLKTKVRISFILGKLKK